MPSINELRNQFDALSTGDKNEYVTQLRNFVETNNKPEYRNFLIECENKYNAEVQREQQPRTTNADSMSGAELPEFNRPVQPRQPEPIWIEPPPPRQAEYNAQQQSPRQAEQVSVQPPPHNDYQTSQNPQIQSEPADVDLLGVAKQQLFAKFKNSSSKVVGGNNSNKLNIAAISTVILGYIGLLMLFVESFIEVSGSINIGFYSGSRTYGMSLMQLIVASETTNVVAIWLVIGMLALTLCAFTKIIPAGVKNTIAVFMLTLLWFSPPISESLVSQIASVSFGPGNAYFTLSAVLVSYITLSAVADRMNHRAERGLSNKGGVITTVIFWLIVLAVFIIPWSEL